MTKEKVPFEIEGKIIEADYKIVDPLEYPLWYQQFLSLDSAKRKKIVAKMMKDIKEAKPDAFKFIEKFNCRLVGIQPRIEYALSDSKDGDIEVTWIHGLSMATLLFWCDEGGFGFFINPVLDYNNSALNKIDGNKNRPVRGFTG